MTPYIVGASTLAIIVAVLFIFWAVLVWTMHCKPQLGFLSGSPMTNASRAPKPVRTTFGFSMGGVFIALLFLVIKAIPYTNQAATLMHTGAQDANQKATEGLSILNQVDAIGRNMTSISTASLNFTTVCPNGDLVPVLGNSADLLNAQTLVTKVEQMLNSSLPTYRQQLQAAQMASSKATSALNTYLKIPVKVVYWLPGMLLSLTFLVGLTLAILNKSPTPFQTTQTNILFPIFFLWLTITAILASAISVYAPVTADFCSGGDSTNSASGSPLGSILEILQQQGYSPTSAEYKAALYYGTECSGTDPLQQYFQFQGTLDSALTEVQGAMSSVQSSSLGMAGLSLLCCGSTTCLSPTFADLNALVTDLQSLSTLATQAKTLLDCETSISPLYQDAVNQGTCNLSMIAASWMLSILLVVTFLGMIAFTLRSALLHLVVVVSSKDEGRDRSSKSRSNKRPSAPVYDDHEDEDEHPVMTKRSWVEMQKSREIFAPAPEEKYIEPEEEPYESGNNNPYGTTNLRSQSTNTKPRSWETVTELDSRVSELDAAPPVLKLY